MLSANEPSSVELGERVPDSHDDLEGRARRYIANLPTLPLPGRGRTLDRWRKLAAIASEDVCLVKILEAHYDAQAILSEVSDITIGQNELLAVWAAESPNTNLEYRASSSPSVDGVKAWCSGASMVDRALVTAHGPEGVQLVLIPMRDEGIQLDESAWHAVGMGRIVSGQIQLSGLAATPVGKSAAYLERPGFWHGGAGVAACWFGAARAIAETLRRHPKIGADVHSRAHLGRVDMSLAAAAALLRETAELIDQAPQAAHQREVIRLRSFVERAATEVIERTGRALGPGPLCGDAAHAQRCADLAVFIRQSHAEHDWTELGGLASKVGRPWEL